MSFQFIQVTAATGNPGENGGYNSYSGDASGHGTYNNASMPNYIPAGTSGVGSDGAKSGAVSWYSVRHADASGANPGNGIDAASSVQGVELGKITFDPNSNRWGFVLTQRGISILPAAAAAAGNALAVEIKDFINGLALPTVTNLGQRGTAILGQARTDAAGQPATYDVALGLGDAGGTIDGAGSNSGVTTSVGCSGYLLGSISYDWVMGRWHFSPTEPTSSIMSTASRTAIQGFIAGLALPPTTDKSGDSMNIGEGFNWLVARMPAPTGEVYQNFTFPGSDGTPVI